MYDFFKYTTKLKPETLEELSLTEFASFWIRISRNQVLSEPFIEKWIDKLSWYGISRCQVLSEQFIEKWSHKVDWPWISGYQNLSLEFLLKHKDKINLYWLKQNNKIPQETKDKFPEITNKI